MSRSGADRSLVGTLPAVPPSALSLPLLFVSLTTVAAFAVRFARARMFRSVIDWWIALALVLIATAVPALVAAWRPWTGAVSFAALVALVLVPVWVERITQRAARLAKRDAAVFFATLGAIIHPSRRNRAQPRSLRILLDLRAGREPTDAELASLSEGNESVAAALRVLVLHARGDIRAVAEAMASSDDRALFFAMGFGLLHVRSVALLDPTPESLVRAVAEASALDPSMRDPDRRALLAAFTLAYAGDRDGAFDAAERLRDYFAPGEQHAVRAFALFCSGDTSGAEREVRAGIDAHKHNVAATRSLEAIARVLATVPPRDRSLHSESLSDLVSRLRAEVRSLAAIAPLEGRTATPWLTLAWSAVLIVAYLWLSLRGNPYEPEHLVRSGALLTATVVTLSDLRSVWWQLFTHGLLHAGVLHLGFNLLAMASFGRFCEAFYGRIRTIVIYLAAAVTSGTAVALTADPLRPTVLVGASGSIFALGGAIVGAVLFDRELRATPRGRRELVVLTLLFVVQSVMDRMVPGISGTAHLAGLATGALLGALFALTRRRR